MSRLQLGLIFSMTMLAVTSCGQRDSDKKQNPVGDPGYQLTPSEQLVGDWYGLYRTLEGSQPFGDPSEVRLNFTSNGLVTILLQDASGARVEAEWQEFQGKSLIMTVTNSTMPRIGTAGKLLEISYELAGQSLILGNDAFQIKAAKRSSTNNPPSGPTTPQYWGQWRCDGAGGRATHIKLQEPSDFTLSSVAPGERVLLVKGTASLDDSKDLRLSPVATSDHLGQGAYFKLSFGDMSKSQLFYNRGLSDSVLIGTCRR
jgi:hypothetical protein